MAALFAASLIAYFGIDHGDTSHHAPDQIAGLAVLLPWPAALVWWYRCHRWEANHRLWLGAAAFWSMLLVIDGFLLFLPGALELTKFTNALVAHAHLAMAGLVTSLNLLMLISLSPRSRLAGGLAATGPWLAWNTACLAMVIALSVLGFLEGGWMRAGMPERTVVQDFYVVRWLSGGAMVAVAILWFVHAALRRPEVSVMAKRDPAPQASVPEENTHAVLA